MDTNPPFNPAALLADMAQLAANIARAWAPVAQLQASQAQQGTLDPHARDAARTFNSVTSGLRHTLALHEKLLHPAKPARHDRYTELRQHIAAELKTAIRAKAEPDRRENLLSELHERLESEDFGTELAHLPLNDIIAILSIRLGITPNYAKSSDHALTFDLNLPNPTTHPREFDEGLAKYIAETPPTNNRHCEPALAGAAIQDDTPQPNNSS